jgi:hypothetical protein
MTKTEYLAYMLALKENKIEINKPRRGLEEQEETERISTDNLKEAVRGLKLPNREKKEENDDNMTVKTTKREKRFYDKEGNNPVRNRVKSKWYSFD